MTKKKHPFLHLNEKKGDNVSLPNDFSQTPLLKIIVAPKPRHLVPPCHTWFDTEMAASGVQCSIASITNLEI